jgi:hypothetical protein
VLCSCSARSVAASAPRWADVGRARRVAGAGYWSESPEGMRVHGRAWAIDRIDRRRRALNPAGVLVPLAARWRVHPRRAANRHPRRCGSAARSPLPARAAAPCRATRPRGGVGWGSSRAPTSPAASSAAAGSAAASRRPSSPRPSGATASSGPGRPPRRRASQQRARGAGAAAVPARAAFAARRGHTSAWVRAQNGPG